MINYLKPRKHICFIILLSLLQTGCVKNDWIDLFDGKTMTGWKPSENKSSWQIVDGTLVTNGSRSHLFYVGDIGNHNFKNFEFVADVKTDSNSNSGIYFHTEFQESGWPDKGYECQVINSSFATHSDNYTERTMTGSLYAIRNLTKSPVKDGEWFRYRIVVQGRTIRTYINDQLMVDYTEPENPFRTDDKKGRILSSGTFALQCHDPNSTVYYKKIRVKPLPDELPTPGIPIEDTEYESRLIDHSGKHIPMMDLHVHLKSGLTVDQALEHARKYGFTYGIAFNCGLKMGFESDNSLRNFLSTYQNPKQAYLGMQAEGREWVDMFSCETIDLFDYVFTDAMTWTNDNGKRMRLWIKEETEVGDPESFMDQLVDRIVGIVENEPIDIYVNATYLPDEINSMYDELWTEKRMDNVIKALADNDVALEISARYKIPSAIFIKRAKEAGVKFTFGTNNTSSKDMGRLEYCIEMVEECNLSRHDFWFPN
ncbi:MAG: DUF1080 domain-containing protein [Bacteroidales bacterium]|nr:DUF1080 domain-containing protein [Bacteroidales bacterium]